ncbi:MAG: A24 family peptidase [Pirellulales bacterium]
MAAWLELSFPLRALIVAVAGVCAGHLANWAIARLRYEPLCLHPWTRASDDGRRAIHYLPLLGWFFRTADETRLGRGFWIRPACVEVFVAGLWTLMLWYSCEELGLIADELRPTLRLYEARLNGVWDPKWLELQSSLHANWLMWSFLSLVMVAATVVDWDEKIIPDEFTVPTTVLAHARHDVAAHGRLAVGHVRSESRTVREMRPLDAASPNDWPSLLHGRPDAASLAIGLGIFSLWCFALLPRTWYGRFGLRRTWRYFAATLVRDGFWRWIAGIWLLGAPAITAVWWRGGDPWRGLFSSLIGLFAGGFTIWAVRIVGKAALGREAMGFGDVTLMCLIGAVAGWQAVLPIFYAAPLAGLLLGVGRWVLRGDRELPYGPFLCFAALAVWFGWSPVWSYLRGPLSEWWLLPGVMLICFVLLGVLLILLRLSQRTISDSEDVPR